MLYFEEMRCSCRFDFLIEAEFWTDFIIDSNLYAHPLTSQIYNEIERRQNITFQIYNLIPPYTCIAKVTQIHTDSGALMDIHNYCPSRNVVDGRNRFCDFQKAVRHSQYRCVFEWIFSLYVPEGREYSQKSK